MCIMEPYENWRLNMKDFLSDVFAVIVGIMVVGVLFAYFTADPRVKAWCDVTTTNPIDQFGCNVRMTINP